MQADVPVVDTASCSRSYQRVESKPVVDHRHLCAGEGTKDSCGVSAPRLLVALGGLRVYVEDVCYAFGWVV